MAKSDRNLGTAIVVLIAATALAACGAPAQSATGQTQQSSASATETGPPAATSQAPARSEEPPSVPPSAAAGGAQESSDNPSIPAASARQVCRSIPEGSIAAAIGLPVNYNPGLSGAVKGVYQSEDGVICTFTTPDLANEASVDIFSTPYPANTLKADRRNSIGDTLTGIGDEAMVAADGIYFRSGITWYHLTLDTAVGHTVGTTGKDVEFGTQGQYTAFAQSVIAAHPQD
ncbi:MULTISPECIES: hypothetical protein [Arthrobacter]|uniref:Lipoprotein n=1 Tax=Arthrobacter terricola TaxID=2547396 RepID=A0A4R5KC60_9MICC|nr:MULTISPECIES: hypothetical protein [Arthrobacter]MBT8162585.1 hypothetical protein [Arthrobacter sp. GN70]TDF92859.1 hypothetical protein E1809_17005 [Arthrobacter terricola]